MFVLRTGKFQFTVCLCMHVCTVCLINYINVKSVHFQKGKQQFYSFLSFTCMGKKENITVKKTHLDSIN